MRTMSFDEAIEEVLALAMADDPRIVIFGEDVQMYRLNLYTQFSERRIRETPISESAFLGAAITAAMAGLRPVVEVTLVDFLGVAMDALLNQASKLEDWVTVVNTNSPYGVGCHTSQDLRWSFPQHQAMLVD